MNYICMLVIGWCALGALAGYAETDILSNGTVFAASLSIPSLESKDFFPEPYVFIEPLTAGRVSHWRLRFEHGRPAELSRRDSSGSYRPMIPAPYPPPAFGYLFYYPAPDATLPNLVVTPEALSYHLLFNEAGQLSAIMCSNSYAERGVPYSCMKIVRRENGDVVRISFQDQEKPSTDAFLVHAKEFKYDTNGFVCGVVYFDAESNVCNDVFGIARKNYLRGSHGEWREISYSTKNGNYTSDWNGVWKYTFDYTNDLRISETKLFGPDGAPCANSFGAHAFIWQYGSDGTLIGTKAFDSEGALVFDGAPIVPDLLNRTWPEEIIERERQELAVPFWQLVDYKELTSALQRWHAYIVAVGYDDQLRAEQIRVIAEHLIRTRAKIAAITAALQCRAIGLNDPRRIAGALLGTGITPHPASVPGEFLNDILNAAIPSNALFLISSEPVRLLSEYHYVQTSRYIPTIPVPLDSVGDLVYLDALRVICGTNFWLPESDDIRDALAEYAEILEKRYERTGRTPVISFDGRRLALKGKDNVDEIKKLLVLKILRNNPSVPVFMEQVPGDTNLFAFMYPGGPVFRLEALTFANPPADYITAVTDYWNSVAVSLKKTPDSPDWREAAGYCARAASAQAGWLQYMTLTNAAGSVYEYALAICPDEPEPYLAYARMLISLKEYTRAISILEQCKHSIASTENTEYLVRNLEESKTRIQRILELESIISGSGIICTSAVMELAELYEAQAESGHAEDIADSLYSRCTNCVDVLEWLVDFYARARNLNKTAVCLDRLIQIQPDSFDNWIRRAALAFEMQQPGKGLDFVRNAAALDRQRLRRMITADSLLQDMLDNGHTNLVKQLQELIEPVE